MSTAQVDTGKKTYENLAFSTFHSSVSMADSDGYNQDLSLRFNKAPERIVWLEYVAIHEYSWSFPSSPNTLLEGV